MVGVHGGTSPAVLQQESATAPQLSYLVQVERAWVLLPKPRSMPPTKPPMNLFPPAARGEKIDTARGKASSTTTSVMDMLNTLYTQRSRGLRTVTAVPLPC